jgi:hypothetical protein
VLRRLLNCLAAAAVVWSVATGAWAQPQWKDRAEYDLYDTINKTTDNAKKLELLREWKTKYPDSGFKEVRYQLLLVTHQQLGQLKELMGVAKEFLGEFPNHLQGLYWITYLTPSLNDNSPGALADGEKAATALLELVKNPSSKPANVPDAQWETTKVELTGMSHKTLGWVAMQRKDNVKAEEQFKASLAVNKSQGEVSYWLGTVILAQKVPEKQAAALYHFARAAAYDGQGSLNAQGRQQVLDYLKKVYIPFHGSDEGLDEILNRAKNDPMPPPGFKIVSKQEIEFQKEEDFRKNEPELYLWKGLKAQLVEGGESYFKERMLNTDFPKMKGTVISARPERAPKEIVIAMLEQGVPEATLVMEKPLRRAPEEGTVIYFQGVPKSYQSSPFMVTFEVEPGKLEGLSQ